VEELLYYLIGFSLTVIGMIASVAYWLGRKFALIDKRFDSLRVEFDGKFESAKAELAAELRNARTELGGELRSAKAELGGKLDALQREVQELRRDFARACEGLKAAVSTSSHALTLDFLALKGLLDEREAGFAKAEIERLISMVRLNPITREELEFLKRVVAKDVNEITLEEAERIVEIGKRWWFEDGSEVAYKVYLGGLVIRGYLISKAVREGGKPWLESPSERSGGG